MMGRALKQRLASHSNNSPTTVPPISIHNNNHTAEYFTGPQSADGRIEGSATFKVPYSINERSQAPTSYVPPPSFPLHTTTSTTNMGNLAPYDLMSSTAINGGDGKQKDNRSSWPFVSHNIQYDAFLPSKDPSPGEFQLIPPNLHAAAMARGQKRFSDGVAVNNNNDDDGSISSGGSGESGNNKRNKPNTAEERRRDRNRVAALRYRQRQNEKQASLEHIIKKTSMQQLKLIQERDELIRQINDIKEVLKHGIRTDCIVARTVTVVASEQVSSGSRRRSVRSNNTTNYPSSFSSASTSSNSS
jgi:hypothetical protein